MRISPKRENVMKNKQIQAVHKLKLMILIASIGRLLIEIIKEIFPW